MLQHEIFRAKYRVSALFSPHFFCLLLCTTLLKTSVVQKTEPEANTDAYARRLQALRERVPSASRRMVMWLNRDMVNPSSRSPITMAASEKEEQEEEGRGRRTFFTTPSTRLLLDHLIEQDNPPTAEAGGSSASTASDAGGSGTDRPTVPPSPLGDAALLPTADLLLSPQSSPPSRSWAEYTGSIKVGSATPVDDRDDAHIVSPSINRESHYRRACARPVKPVTGGGSVDGLVLLDGDGDGGGPFPRLQVSPTAHEDELGSAFEDDDGSSSDDCYPSDIEPDWRKRRNPSAESQGRGLVWRRRQWQPMIKDREASGNVPAVKEVRTMQQPAAVLSERVDDEYGDDYGSITQHRRVGRGDEQRTSTSPAAAAAAPLFGRLHQALKNLTAKGTLTRGSGYLGRPATASDADGGGSSTYFGVPSEMPTISNLPPRAGVRNSTTASNGLFYPNYFGGRRAVTATAVVAAAAAAAESTSLRSTSRPSIPAWGGEGQEVLDPILPPPASTIAPVSFRPYGRERREREQDGRGGGSGGVGFRGKSGSASPSLSVVVAAGAEAAALKGKTHGGDDILRPPPQEAAADDPTLEWPSLLGAIGSKAPQSPSRPFAAARLEGHGVSPPRSPSVAASATPPPSLLFPLGGSVGIGSSGGGGGLGALIGGVAPAAMTATHASHDFCSSPRPRPRSPYEGGSSAMKSRVPPRVITPFPSSFHRSTLFPPSLPATCEGVGVEVAERLRERAWLAGTRTWAVAGSGDVVSGQQEEGAGGGGAREKDRRERTLGQRFNREAVGALFPLGMVLQVGWVDGGYCCKMRKTK